MHSLKQAWVYNGIQSLDFKTNRTLYRYYIGIRNKFSKNEEYYSNYFDAFYDFIKKNDEKSYGFEILSNKKFLFKKLS